MFQKTRQASLRLGVLTAAACLTLSAATAQVPASQVIVLEGGVLIDGTGKAPVSDPVIVVEGGRIKGVGRRGQLAIPAGAKIINTAGRTILPGLIDVHVHSPEWHWPMFLHYGVTTVVDLFSDTPWILAQRDGIKSGLIKGPRLFASGTFVWGPLRDEKNPFNVPPVRSVAEAHAYTRALIASGVDVIKTDDGITDEELAAVIQEANAAGLPAIGHTQNILRAVKLGFKFDEHMDTMARSLIDPDEKMLPFLQPSRVGPVAPPQVTAESLIDPKQLPPLVKYMVSQGVFVNPTLVGSWMADDPLRAQQLSAEAAKLAKDPDLAFVPAYVKERWTRPVGGKRAGWDNVVTFLREYAQAGGKVVVGTDASDGQTTIPGLSLHYEMLMLNDVGIPAMKVIQGATLWNAQVIKKDKDLGSVEAGKIADFTIIEGDPLKDLSVTKNVRMLIKDGKIIDTKYDPKWVNPLPEPWPRIDRAQPQITQFAPREVRQGSQTVTVELDGDHFAPNAIARFDTADLPTHFVSPTKVTATINASLLTRAPGSYSLYVVNPGIHGTVSEPAYLLVNFKK